MSGLGGMRPSGGDTYGTGLWVTCDRCGQDDGPFGECPDRCPQCGASGEHLDYELRQVGGHR